jgi:hypothetical protein
MMPALGPRQRMGFSVSNHTLMILWIVYAHKKWRDPARHFLTFAFAVNY